MNRITLKQLRYFDAVIKYRHFGNAAHACSITQPALSMQIKHLEEELGHALFERRVKDTHLTGFGEKFAEQAVKLLNSADALELWVEGQQKQAVSRLRLGVIPTIGPYILPKLIEELRGDFAGLDLQIRETMTQSIVEALREGSLDAAIVALPISDPSIEEREIASEDFLLVRPKDDTSLKMPNLSALREMRWLLLEEGHCFRNQALEVCGLDQRHLKEVLDASSLTTLVQMVASGMGVTLIPEMARSLEARQVNVEILPFPNARLKRRIGLIWRKGSALSEEMEAVFSSLKNVMVNLTTCSEP